MNSVFYSNLHQRIDTLQRAILPSVEDFTDDLDREDFNTANYRDSWHIQEKTAAYRLMVHAEIENYFESAVKEIALKSFNKWNADKTDISIPLLSLLATSTRQIIVIDSDRIQQRINNNENSFVEDNIRLSYSEFHRIIKNNNGINKTHILKLLVPIGISEFTIDTDMLTRLDAFSRKRGDVAHSGVSDSTVSIRESLDPTRELRVVNEMMEYIKIFDENQISPLL